MTDPKPRPNRALEIEIARRMTGEQRLKKALELTELSRSLMKQGIRNRHPELSESEIHTLYLKQLARCHKANC